MEIFHLVPLGISRLISKIDCIACYKISKMSKNSPRSFMVRENRRNENGNLSLLFKAFLQCYKLQISLDHACTCITGSNPFYTPKLNASTMVNGIILILETLYKGLIQKWQKVNIATLIKFTFSNFVYLEPGT